MSYTVGRVSRLLGVSVRSLHHYEEIGLLVASQRSASGYRLYSQADIDRLYRIQTLRELGWSLAEVRSVLAGQDVQIAARLDTQIRDLEQSIEEATELRLRLMQVRQHLPSVDSQTALGWLELFNLYNKHLSSTEIQRLPQTLDARERSEWQRLYADAASAMELDQPTTTLTAQELAKRWLSFVARQLGSDLSLSSKLVRAYSTDGAVRATLASVASVQPAVLRFIWAAVADLHRSIVASHFTIEERAYIRLSDELASDRAAVVARLWSALKSATAAEDVHIEAALRDWHRHVDTSASGEDDVRRKLLRVLSRDCWLRQLWMISEELHKRMTLAGAYCDEELTD